MLSVVVPSHLSRLTTITRRYSSSNSGQWALPQFFPISCVPQPEVVIQNRRQRKPRGCCYISSTPIRMARIRPSSAKIVASIGKPQPRPIRVVGVGETVATTQDDNHSPSELQEVSKEQNGMKAIDDEWDDYMRNLDPDSFVPFPIRPNVNGTKAEPWKTILEYPARAAWRVASTVPPTSFQYAYQQIITNSIALTKKQTSRKYLRKVFETTILQQQHLLLLKRERERQRILRNTSIKEIDAQREAGILPISYGPNETMAMYYFRTFTYFSITQRILLELQSLLSNSVEYPLSVRRIYDFGIGNGSATAAAIHVLPTNQIEWIHGIDPSQTMRDSAKYFLQELVQQHHTEAFVKQEQKQKTGTNDDNVPAAPLQMPQMTFSSNASAGSTTSNEMENSGTLFDLSFLTYTAMELSQTAAILGAAAICYDKLRVGGVFIMIEPGTPDGFTNIRTVRNMLLDCFPTEADDDEDHGNVREVCHVIAPCTHSGKCPMERFKKYDMKKESTQHNLDDIEDGEGSSESDDDSDSDESDTSDDERDDDGTNLSKDDADDDDGIRKGYCSFVHSMPGGGGRGEKFSYLVVQKRLSTNGKANATTTTAISSSSSLLSNQHNFDDINIPSIIQNALTKAKQISGDSTEVLYSDEALLKEALHIEKRFLASDDDNLGLELVRGDINRHTYGRIVRAPKKHRGHVLIDTCVAPGKIVRSKVSRSLSKQFLPGIYPASRKSRWGGLWPTVPNLLVKWKE